jgi:hypothetical protein
MPIIQDLQDHMLSLEYQSSNHAYLEISLEPSFLGPNYNAFTICDQEFGCEDDHEDDESYFENIHWFIQDLELYNTFSNPLFQSEGVKEFNNCMHSSIDMYASSFDNDDKFKDIPMFLNHLYECSLHYDDPISDRNIATNEMKMFDESINPIPRI